MLKQLMTLLSIILIIGCTMPNFGFQVIPAEQYTIKIHWLGDAGFMLEANDTRIYINPYSASIGNMKGDIILISQSNSDLCDENSIRNLAKEQTLIIAPAECSARLANIQSTNIKIGQTYNLPNVIVQTVDAYQLNAIKKNKDAIS